MISVQVPPSKSLTQRALVLAALCPRPTVLRQPLDCEDSRVLRRALGAFGAEIVAAEDGWIVRGPHSLQAPAERLWLGNAGTAVRFMTGLAPVLGVPYVVDGVTAMRRRPMAGLLGALDELGVAVTELGTAGCPPVMIDPTPARRRRDAATGKVRLRAGGSSQELSALLLMAAGLEGAWTIEVDGSVPSQPYVDLTVASLAAFGVAVSRPAADRYQVAAGRAETEQVWVEGDWSSASYPLAAGWLTGEPVEVTNLAGGSLQGDRLFPVVLERMSQPGPRVLSLRDTPDLVPTTVACALFAEGQTTIVDVAHLRIKESDRLGVLARELRKIGGDLSERADGIVVRPRPLHGSARLDPARDHRLAMAFGLVSLRVPNLSIVQRDCVGKSYPGFWDMLSRFSPITAWSAGPDMTDASFLGRNR